MMFIFPFRKLLTAACLLSPILSWAAPAEDHGHRSHEAHVHGLAELAIVLEGNTLELRFRSPAANIVGFEHRASSPEQRLAVENARKDLKLPQQLFNFAGTRCELNRAIVDVSEIMNSDENKHMHHAEEGSHDKHHDKDEHDGEKSSDHHHASSDKHHNDKHSHSDAHSEVTAHYQFSCSQGAQLMSVSVGLMERFPGIEKINAMWVTETKQGAAELTAKSQDLRLR